MYVSANYLTYFRKLNTPKKILNSGHFFGYFDSSSGIRPIVGKLPYGLQEKWTTRASTYKSRHDVPFPPFILQIHTGNEYSKKRSRIQLWTRVAVNHEIYRKTISRSQRPGNSQIKQASKEVQRSLEEIPGAPCSGVQKAKESLTVYNTQDKTLTGRLQRIQIEVDRWTKITIEAE